MSPALGLAAWLLLLVCVPAAAPAQVRIVVDEGRIEVHGLSQVQLNELRQAGEAAWSERLTLHVESESLPSSPGVYQLTPEGLLQFVPRFPLAPEVPYLAVFRLGLERGAAEPIVHEFSLAAKTMKPSTSVVAIYPSSLELPENLLRFYIHFSAPMSQGDAYRHLDLLDHNGKAVKDAFLELEQELWDAEGRRLTLLFDPGRIKSGLKPKLEVGSALDVGHHFELVVDQAWRDSAGNPLITLHRHRFRTAAPDYQGADPNRWQLSSPRISTLDALTVELDEPLDHALLERLIEVQSHGKPLPGRITLSDNETQWSFQPERPWQDQPHQLVIDVRLEDRAGNRIDRPFERDLQAGQGVSKNGATSDGEQPVSRYVRLDLRLSLPSP